MDDIIYQRRKKNFGLFVRLIITSRFLPIEQKNIFLSSYQHFYYSSLFCINICSKSKTQPLQHENIVWDPCYFPLLYTKSQEQWLFRIKIDQASKKFDNQTLYDIFLSIERLPNIISYGVLKF